MSESYIKNVADSTEGLVGSCVSAARLRGGSYLMIDLVKAGKPLFLWVAAAAWRIEYDDHVLSANEDDHPHIEAAIGTLAGQEVLDVYVGHPGLDLVVALSQCRINVFPCHSGADPDNYDAIHWATWLDSDQVLATGPGEHWSVEHAACSRMNAQREFAEKLVPGSGWDAEDTSVDPD